MPAIFPRISRSAFAFALDAAIISSILLCFFL